METSRNIDMEYINCKIQANIFSVCGPEAFFF